MGEGHFPHPPIESLLCGLRGVAPLPSRAWQRAPCYTRPPAVLLKFGYTVTSSTSLVFEACSGSPVLFVSDHVQLALKLGLLSIPLSGIVSAFVPQESRSILLAAS